jgi:[NiFe] hydrogenase assembly HybE family chaperone
VTVTGISFSASTAAVANSPQRLLEQAFVSIERGRMGDVPILNRALSVQAVGFRPWREGLLGALVTPWLMGLVIVPPASSPWAEAEPGGSHVLDLPAGTFEFVHWREAPLGDFLMCSLFSPMEQFADQDAAAGVAAAAVDVLAADRASAEPKISRRAWLRGGFLARHQPGTPS